MSQAVARDDSAVSAERRGAAGFILLDRPKALNALTLPMARTIAAALDDFESDARVARVVIMSAGGRAFCSGGDIRLFHQLGRAGEHAAQLDFWREEYRLNRRIARYAKPIVALVDGIVMGGGVGLSIHASHRVVSEKCLFAMPEVGIGFFPDVGATYALARLPHRIGALLVATGMRIEADDVELLDLDRALNELDGLDPRKCHMVELRFFLGFSAEETAQLLCVSKATVDRDLRFVRGWMFERLRRSDP